MLRRYSDTYVKRLFPLPEFDEFSTVRVSLEDLTTSVGSQPVRQVPWSGMEWVDEYTLEEGLAEVDFFTDQHLIDDALETLEALVTKFGSQPRLEARMDRLDRATLVPALMD